MDSKSFKCSNSLILTETQKLDLITLCGFSLDEKWELIYRGSDELLFGTVDFYADCYEHTETLTIIKAAESNFVFGCYISNTWDFDDDDEEYMKDADAFLFSLTNRENLPCKIKIKEEEISKAISSEIGSGPCFGQGDIRIDDIKSAFVKAECFSDLGKTYAHPFYAYGSARIR
jgi:hypothetical protein